MDQSHHLRDLNKATSQDLSQYRLTSLHFSFLTKYRRLHGPCYTFSCYVPKIHILYMSDLSRYNKN